MQISHTSTVAAISTPFGKGGVALIRISGSDTRAILDRVFVPGGKHVPSLSPRRAVFGQIVSPLTGQFIDTGIATFFASPASFTGEDMAELSCHGGILVTKKVLEAVFAAGASPAEAGEFTRRAFIEGKLSLSEAEAVGLLLDADTESRMRLAASGTAGVLSKKLSLIGDSVAEVLTSLFALIDYPEEDIDELERCHIVSSLRAAADSAAALADTYRTGRAVAKGIPTLICGIPNAGKSSLYNALLGTDRAIVTTIPGTTRDVLEDTVDAGGVTLRLWDTAGIRESGDTVEAMGIQRALSKMDEAELILTVFDGSQSLSEEDILLLRELERRTCGKDTVLIGVINKSDSPTVLTEGELSKIRSVHSHTVTVSALTGDGIAALTSLIGELYGLGGLTVGTDAVIWDATRKAELDSAAALLHSAADSLLAGEPEDAVCSTAELALAALRRTDGRGVSEEIVNGIFSKFCVGK